MALSRFNLLAIALVGSIRLAAAPLVTGNGFGFAVVDEGSVTKFFVHPYKFERPTPGDPYGDGIETANLVHNLRWEGESFRSARYLAQSHIVSVQTWGTSQHFFMPFGLNYPALIAAYEPGPEGDRCLEIEWAHPVKATEVKAAYGREATRVMFEDIRESALLIPLDRDSSTTRCLSGRAWALVSLEAPATWKAAMRAVLAWQRHLPGPLLASRELWEVEQWRVKPSVTFLSNDERRLWRQSEIILRMAQSREPNRRDRWNHGLIVAALPEGGWFSPWVRDMAYAVKALIHMGHKLESRWAIEAFFNARPVGRVQDMVRGFPYQIPVVRYFGDGSEETNFSGALWPVVEFDNWGLVLQVLTEYVEKFGDIALLSQADARLHIYETARDFVFKPLLGNLDPYGTGQIVTADNSVWEADPGAERHFAYSTAAAIAGFRGFARLSALKGDDPTRRWAETSALSLENGFEQAFVRDGFVHGTLEDEFLYDVDSAVLETINFKAVRDPRVIQTTLDMMELLKMPSGGYRRIRGGRQYDKQEFLFSNFNWSRVHLNLRNTGVAQVLVGSMVGKAMTHNGYIPEMYVSEINDEYPGQIGEPAGSTPMAGYGAGMFIKYLLERESNPGSP